jgi:hypothetical protein
MGSIIDYEKNVLINQQRKDVYIYNWGIVGIDQQSIGQ